MGSGITKINPEQTLRTKRKSDIRIAVNSLQKMNCDYLLGSPSKRYKTIRPSDTAKRNAIKTRAALIIVEAIENYRAKQSVFYSTDGLQNDTNYIGTRFKTAFVCALKNRPLISPPEKLDPEEFVKIREYIKENLNMTCSTLYLRHSTLRDMTIQILDQKDQVAHNMSSLLRRRFC
jgi:hypothetical protein